MRHAIAGLALCLAATLAACGGGGSQGGACGTTCNGCCLGTTCVAGTDPTGCGSGSTDCKVCSPGQACASGLCTQSVQQAIGGKCATGADCAEAACAADVPGGGYCTKDCSTTGTCPTGAACVGVSGTAKLCLKTCAADGDCRAEHLCFLTPGSAGLCLPKCTGDGDCGTSNCDTASGRCGVSRVGNACAIDSDCGQLPAFCDKTQATGYCSLPCGGQKSSACPSGSNCSSAGGGSACLKSCSADGDCRSGFYCNQDGSGVKSCTPKCTVSGSVTTGCGAGQRCDTGTGHCLNGGPASGQLGGACAANGDCTASVGAGAVCSNYPGGYCTVSCASVACGAGGTCVSFSNGDQFCLNQCTTAADCRSAYFCFNLGGGFGSVCTPKCTSDAQCATGQVCDKSGGACVAPSTGGSTSIQVVALNQGQPIQVGTSTLTPPNALGVDIPADAVSVTFIGTAVSDPTARVVVYRVYDPNNNKLYDYASTSNVMKVLPPTGPGAFSVLVPNSPTVPFGAGNYSIRLLATKNTTANVSALIKRSPAQALTGGSIDLNLFFVGLPNLTAATAQDASSTFQTIFQAVKDTWKQAGITVGKVTYIDLASDAAAKYKDLQEPDLGALMQLSSNPAANDNALNVFFVHTITGGSLDGYIILGESSGIPGVPVRGTTGSGLAVTMADYPNGTADIADTWVHEGSHWLGLFHTTESAGTSFDPLPDTAECPQSSRDNDGDKIMQPQECVGFGADNEMFWTSVSSIPHSKLTGNQQFVLLRNPAVH